MSEAINVRQPAAEVVSHFLTQAPVNLDQMATALGLRVERIWFDDPEVAGSIARSGATYHIAINALDPPRRQRFTLAHEIAHYVLHRDLIGDGITDRGLYRSKLGGTIERQANRYAANILMPAHLVRQAWELSHNTADIAQRFNVSEDAATIRLRELGLAS